MDLISLDTSKISQDGAFCHFVHPSTKELLFLENESGEIDKTKPIGVWLIGADSQHWRQLQNTISRKLGNKKGNRNPEEIENAATEQLAGAVLKFVNVIFEGKSAEKSDAFMIFDRLRWAREQAAEFVSERSNFLPNA